MFQAVISIFVPALPWTVLTAFPVSAFPGQFTAGVPRLTQPVLHSFPVIKPETPCALQTPLIAQPVILAVLVAGLFPSVAVWMPVFKNSVDVVVLAIVS